MILQSKIVAPTVGSVEDELDEPDDDWPCTYPEVGIGTGTGTAGTSDLNPFPLASLARESPKSFIDESLGISPTISPLFSNSYIKNYVQVLPHLSQKEM